MSETDFRVKARKPGRPRAIPETIEPIVVKLYQRGYGYRAISGILRQEYQLDPHFSSVCLMLKRLGATKRRPLPDSS